DPLHAPAGDRLRRRAHRPLQAPAPRGLRRRAAAHRGGRDRPRRRQGPVRLDRRLRPPDHRAASPRPAGSEGAFLVVLVADGALAGAVYALVSLAFVVVYKASRMINFALGEWVLLASRLVASGLHVLGLGLLGAMGVGGAGMAAVAAGFSRLVLRRL